MIQHLWVILLAVGLHPCNTHAQKAMLLRPCFTRAQQLTYVQKCLFPAIERVMPVKERDFALMAQAVKALTLY